MPPMGEDMTPRCSQCVGVGRPADADREGMAPSRPSTDEQQPTPWSKEKETRARTRRVQALAFKRANMEEDGVTTVSSKEAGRAEPPRGQHKGSASAAACCYRGCCCC